IGKEAYRTAARRGSIRNQEECSRKQQRENGGAPWLKHLEHEKQEWQPDGAHEHGFVQQNRIKRRDEHNTGSGQNVTTLKRKVRECEWKQSADHGSGDVVQSGGPNERSPQRFSFAYSNKSDAVANIPRKDD